MPVHKTYQRDYLAQIVLVGTHIAIVSDRSVKNLLEHEAIVSGAMASVDS